MEEKVYEFNDCGVCINADIITICSEIKIRFAKVDDKYIYGISVNLKNCGYGVPCSASFCTFDTKEEAEDDAIRCIMKYLKGNDINYPANTSIVKDCLSKLREYTYKKKEITLF